MKKQFYVPMQAAPQGSKTAFTTRPKDPSKKPKTVLRESSARVKPYRQAVKMSALAAGLRPQKGPISLVIIFVRKAKANAPKSYTPFVTTLPDIDKQLRATLDGLTGVAYFDDGQVCQVNMAEIYPNEDFPKVGVYIVYSAGKDVPDWLGSWPRGKEPDF